MTLNSRGTASFQLVTVVLLLTLAFGVQAAQRPGSPTNIKSFNQTITWKPPKNDGGKAIIGYRIVCLSPTGKNRTASVSKATTTQYTFHYYTSLTVGKKYTCSVSAVNALGTGLAQAAPPFKPAIRGSKTPKPPQIPSSPPDDSSPDPSPSPPKNKPPPSSTSPKFSPPAKESPPSAPGLPGQATATATISGGSVSGTVITSGGSGYTSAPTVTVSEPKPVAASASFSVDNNGNPLQSAAVGSNGPYASAPTAASTSAGTCIDIGNNGMSGPAVLSGSCSGPMVTIQVAGNVKTGSLCTASDFNTKCSGGTSSCISFSNNAVQSVSFPGSSSTNVLCTSTLTVTFTSASLQPAVTAQISASISVLQVTSLTITNAGSGYLTVPTVTIASPEGLQPQLPPPTISPAPNPNSPPADTPAENQATGVTTVSGGSLSSVSVTKGGFGYTTVPIVTVAAPNALAATVTYQLTTAFNPSGGSATAEANGPYGSAPIVIFSSNNCVDIGNLGNGGPPGSCRGPQVTYQVNGITRTGSLCIASDFNTMCNGGTSSCVMLIGSAVQSVSFPGSSPTNVFCTSSPVVSLSTATLQPGVPAQITASISSGAVTQLTITSHGSGYLTAPYIVIAAPAVVTPSPPPAKNPSPPAGVAATATATIFGGSVSGSIVISGGSGYTNNPTVTVAAANRIAASVSFSLDNNGTPIQPAALGLNGPYVSAPTVDSLSGVNCVDTGNTGSGGLAGSCSGPMVTIQVAGNTKMGSLCTASDFNTKCSGGTSSCISFSNNAVQSVSFPGSSSTNVFCTSSPTLVFSTTTWQTPVTAIMSAAVSGGSVVALIVIAQGSGYATPPAITIAPP